MELGRGFSSTNDKPSESSVVVLSNAFWRKRFNADPTIVGRSITLQGRPFTVVGVTSPRFIGTTPDAPSFWAPLFARDELIQRGGWGFSGWSTDRDVEVFTIMARLAPGVSSASAQAAVELTTDRLAQSYPRENRKTSVALERAGTFVTLDEDLTSLVLPLMIGFSLVLLVACANVANLLLARAFARQREIGVRLALGASRWKVIRQLLTESVVLAGLGGVAGLLVTIWTLRVAYPIVLSSLPIPELASGFVLDLSPDWRIFGFTLIIAAIAGTAAGLAPAIQASSPNLVAALKDESSVGYLSKSRLRSALVVAQVAVSLTLLIAAGLLAFNLRRIRQADTGMVTKNVFAVAVGLSNVTNDDTNRQVRLRRELSERLRALPDVVSVSEAFRQPLSGQMGNTLVRLPTDTGNHPRETRFNFVSADYFQTLSIPILKGRSFTTSEVTSNALVVVISQATAERLWPGRDAIGQQVAIVAGAENPVEKSAPATPNYRQYEVVGIARDTRGRWLWQKDESMVYVPIPTSQQTAYLLVQTGSDPAGTMSTVRGLAVSTDPELRVSVRRIDDSLAYQTAPFQAIAWLSGMLGLLALILASLGLYGVTSFLVARRTHEIGIRMALGAQTTDVVRMFLMQGLRLTAIGIFLGLLGGALISQLLVSVLIDLSPFDPLAFATVSAFLCLVAVVAILSATHRATRVDPMEALRYE